jgi:GNAT superfamily N-acetyltransferase
VPGDLDNVVALVREAAAWLGSMDIDQWQTPWPDADGQRERILNDLYKGKTWLVREGETVAATITIDTDEPTDVDERPVWPAEESQPRVLYVRRVIVSRRYAGLGLGAALLDWAAEVAETDYGAELIRIDVRTTNLKLHAYYEGQGFTPGPKPEGLSDYPSQALFQRGVDVPRSDFTKMFSTEGGHETEVPSLSRRQP